MTFNWVSASLVSAAILAIVHVVDSHLISKRLPSVQSYLLVLGFIILIVSTVIIILFPLPSHLDNTTLVVAILSGVLRATSVYLMFYTLKREEVSMVIPIVNSYPILVALFAMPIVGEFLDTSQWIAMIIVVLGVILATFRGASGGKITWSGRVLCLLLAASAFWALSEVMAKYALAAISPWQMYALSHFSMAFIFLVISLRPRILSEWARHKKRSSAIIIIIFNETIAVISVVLLYWAMERGPVSLVSAVSSTRPVFVFIYALIISRFSELLLERRANKGILLLRFIAVTMIAGGVALIYLT
ncbi:MAG: DMT family transporter [Chloroflexi bacterium]|nr:DMT family transporter [Chloroflexota bacterium]